MDKYQKDINSGVQMTDTGSFRGYAARFLNIDRQGDIILPGAFTKAVEDFVNDGGLVLADHQNKTSSVVGTIRNATEDRSGLLVDVACSATKSGQEIRQLMRENAVRKMSIRFIAKRPEKYTEKQVIDLWQKYNYTPSAEQRQMAKGGANIIKDVAEIYEVSVVPIPANKEASILAVKGADNSPIGGLQQSEIQALFERAKAADSILLGCR